MRVEVVLKGPLAGRLPGGRETVELPDAATVNVLRGLLGLPSGPCVYVVNGVAVGPGSLLSDGDRVQVFPPVAGGRSRLQGEQGA